MVLRDMRAMMWLVTRMWCSDTQIGMGQKGGNIMANGKTEEMQTRILPKNFRQVGDPGTKKIYMEDYVYTYLSRMAQPGNLYARGAILFGKMYQTAVGPCLFISGAAACQNFEFDLEETVFSEEVWNGIYRTRDEYFPGMEIVGWFLSRMGFSVELNDKIIRMHMDNFSGENKVLYMMDVLENEDAFYQLENYSLKKQRGYYLYYETNEEMKNYMLAEGEAEPEPENRRRSDAILRDSSVIKNYKKVLKQNQTMRKKQKNRTPAVTAGAVVAAAVLLYSARSVYQFQKAENSVDVLWQEDMDTENATTTESSSTEETGKTAAAEVTTGELAATEEFQTEEIQTEENRTEESATTGTTETELFTQEEPAESRETWSYIGSQYTVKQGDTLAGISRKMYESYDYIEMLADVNGIENVDEIYPGQILEIPQIED